MGETAVKIIGRRRGEKTTGKKRKNGFHIQNVKKKKNFFLSFFCTLAPTSQDLSLKQWNTTLITSKIGGREGVGDKKKKKNMFTLRASPIISRGQR